jgi:argininosuccinate lyase
MTLWDKGDSVHEAVLAFSAGEEYQLDLRLVPYDCRASIAHVTMLGAIGAVDASECAQLVGGLEEITRLHARGEFAIRREQEDCHTAIEEWLTAHVGDAGKKIHLGRSRNDQVLTALRLCQKEALAGVRQHLDQYRDTLVHRAAAFADIPMPGYTHMRRAMPTTVETWLTAFAESAKDDRAVLDGSLALVDQSPLGTGAGYGVPVFELDRAATATELGFAAVQQNPIHAHMSRGKYEGVVLSALSQILFGLNRLATDILLFSMPELGFVRLPVELCTGSSIMPQKRNPDLLELVRANYHVVLAEEFKVKSLIGNLMTGYQRDLGLTKAPVFATEDAYKLVQDGVPFRDAYRRVAERYRRP